MSGKQELIEGLAKATGLGKAQVCAVVEALPGVVQKGITEDGEASLPGIGKLVRVTRAARMGRNPRTGEAVPIQEKRAARFKPASTFSAALQQ